MRSFTKEQLDARVPFALFDGTGRRLVCYSQEQAEALRALCDDPESWEVQETTWEKEGLSDEYVTNIFWDADFADSPASMGAAA